MNTYTKSSYKPLCEVRICTLETLTTGSWTIVYHKMKLSRRASILHKDTYTGSTQITNRLMLPNYHVWIINKIRDHYHDDPFTGEHIVSNQVSSENITIELFYRLFSKLPRSRYPKYMRVSAAFADLKFDFLHSVYYP